MFFSRWFIYLPGLALFILSSVLFSVSDHNGSYRPLPRVALSIVYMVSTLLNRQVFILEIIQKVRTISGFILRQVVK